MSPRNEYQPGGDQTNQNSGQQGIDKDPGEEKSKNEKVRPEDLKGKKVDADPATERDQPLKQSQ